MLTAWMVTVIVTRMAACWVTAKPSVPCRWFWLDEFLVLWCCFLSVEATVSWRLAAMIGCVVKAKEVFAFAAPPAVLRAEVDIALKA